MKLLDLTVSSPPHAIALDEALLDLCEEGTGDEVLSFWEPRSPFVVLGHSCRVHEDVHVEACEARGIPILRRHSGGGTVLQMPGCLNYALVLDMVRHRELETITGTNSFVMKRLRRALARVAGEAVRVDGHTDLVLHDRKFCGNAQRRRLRSVLFHGVLLLDAEIPLIEATLRMPPRQPAYRDSRSHREFLTNIGVAPELVRQALAGEWGAEENLEGMPAGRMEDLVRTKYGTREWNFQR